MCLSMFFNSYCYSEKIKRFTVKFLTIHDEMTEIFDQSINSIALFHATDLENDTLSILSTS